MKPFAARNPAYWMFAFMLIWLVGRAGLPAWAYVSVGGKAPGFTLMDLEGGAQSLAGLRGKIVVLTFWATWCPSCVAQMPHTQKLSNDFKDEGVVVLGINSQQPRVAARFMLEKGYTLRTLTDPYGKVAGMYGVAFIPYLVVIDREGKVYRTFVGAGRQAEIRAAVAKLLEKKPRASTAKAKSAAEACEILQFDSPPVRVAGRILVPMRGVLEWLGATVKWNAPTRAVTAQKGPRRLSLRVGSRNARINGKSLMLDVPPQIMKSRVYAPLRFVSESLGMTVAYKPEDGGILLESASKCGFVRVPQ